MIFIAAAFLLLIHLFILLHLQFIAWPEMFSYPYLINNGFDLYKDIGLPYQPLFSLLLVWLYQLFGNSINVLENITWVIVLISDVLIFFISLKIIGKKLESLLPLGFFVILQPLMDGANLWFDLGTVPFILLAIFFFVYTKGLKRYLFLGFFLCLACLVKQQTAVYLPFIFIYLLIIKKIKESSIFFIGSLIPIVITLIFVISKGIFSDYFFWSVLVPLVWYPKFPGYAHFPNKLQVIEAGLLFGPGIFWSLKNWLKSKEELKVIFLIFAALFITAIPRFEFFRFQEALAAYIVLIAVMFRDKYKFSILLGIALAASLFFIRTNFGNFPPRFYGPDDFVLAQKIDSMTSPSDKIFLLNIDSLKYVLANRLPPKPWIDNYVWYMEIPGIQEKVITGFEKETPKYIFRKSPQLGNWYDLGTYEPKKLVDYMMKNYKMIGTYKDSQIWELK